MKNHWLIVIAAACALAFTGCNKGTEATEEKPAAEATDKAADAAASTEEPGVSYDAKPADAAQDAPVATPASAPEPAAADAATSAPEQAAAPATEQTLPGGTRYTDLIVGTGAEATPGATVSVHYTGTLENGTKFDSSRDRNQPFDFNIGGRQVIAGWEEGVAGMKVGGRRKLVIPPNQAYGNRQMGPIPPNSSWRFPWIRVGRPAISAIPRSTNRSSSGTT